MSVSGRDRSGFQRGFDLERRIGFGTVEGIIGITILCAARLCESMQLAEVMTFEGFGEIAQELEQFSGRLVGQLQRDTHDGEAVRFHGASRQAFFSFFSARDLALRAARSCASLRR
jgi:hypothetical protein